MKKCAPIVAGTLLAIEDSKKEVRVSAARHRSVQYFPGIRVVFFDVLDMQEQIWTVRVQNLDTLAAIQSGVVRIDAKFGPFYHAADFRPAAIVAEAAAEDPSSPREIEIVCGTLLQIDGSDEWIRVAEVLQRSVHNFSESRVLYFEILDDTENILMIRTHRGRVHVKNGPFEHPADFLPATIVLEAAAEDPSC